MTTPTQPAPNRYWVLSLTMLATFMTTLDGSIVNIGLPSIARAFGATVGGSVEWVVIGYLVTIAAVLLTLGRLSDLLGRRPVWLWGLALFIAGSAACGAAPSLGALIAARVAQGLGAACIFSLNIALVSDAFGAQRGRALGFNAVVLALGTSLGPTLGVLITEHWSWRWIFYLNVPIGLAALLLSARVLPVTGRSGKVQFDPLGALCLAVGLATLTLGLSFGEAWGWLSAPLLTTLTLSVLALGAAWWAENRAPSPVVPPALLKTPAFAWPLVSLVLAQLALYATSFLMPFYYKSCAACPPRAPGCSLHLFPSPSR